MKRLTKNEIKTRIVNFVESNHGCKPAELWGLGEDKYNTMALVEELIAEDAISQIVYSTPNQEYGLMEYSFLVPVGTAILL